MPRSEMQEPAPGKSFGGFLVDRGLLDQARLQRALRLHDETGEEIDTILTKMGFVSERDIANALAAYLDVPVVDPDEYPVAPVMSGRFSTNFIRDARVIPLAETAEGLVVAMASPMNDYARKAMEMVAGMPVLPRVGIPAEIEAAFERLYGADRAEFGELVDGTDEGDGASDLDDIERLRGLASEAPVIRLVNLLITRAVESRASDIHIEPFDKDLKVRYRIDGVLRNVDAPPANLLAAVISRIKIMANLNIAERRLPQDGRIRMIVRGNEVDLRISIVPTIDGENAVIRILDRSSVSLEFPRLGFDDETLDNFLPVLRRPNGILLVTGPTGSGKTTTLYTCLRELNTDDKKLLSVEDPVEYQLKGVNQIQVRPQIGLTFASALRAFLRQDPDIIMVGEIRDLETAQISVQAALTGHLVLSTVHTNDAAGTVTRLLDMGVEDYLLTSTLNGVLAQRLVRTLCPDCREPYAALPELVDQMQLDRFVDGGEITLYRPKGCRTCGDTGFLGRSAISELLVMSDALRQSILRGADAGAIQEIALSEGMVSMYEDGLQKVLQGRTTVEEVLRVTRET